MINLSNLSVTSKLPHYEVGKRVLALGPLYGAGENWIALTLTLRSSQHSTLHVIYS